MLNIVLNKKGYIHLLLIFTIVSVAILIFTYIFALKNKVNNNFSAKATVPTDTSYNMNVLILKYFPLTADGQNIDIAVTGDVGDPYTTIKQRTVDVTNNLASALSKASKYLGYKDPVAQASLIYQIIDSKEYTQAVPMLTDGTRRPDYNRIMTSHNICDYVDNKGVREVWLWAYQGPTFPGSSYPYLSISESKMAGPYGDISNSDRSNNMPVCHNTYRVYTFNYGRGTSEAMESWGHQFETEISTVDNNLFRNIWQGPNYPQTLGVNGRCGSVHNPPNARYEYDRSNPNPQNSDCLDWNADSLGTLSAISCGNWGCGDISDSNNSPLNYMIWNWQNLPGRGNTKTYQGQLLRNFWDIHGNFDVVMGSDKTLVLSATGPTPTPAPITQIVSDSFNRADSATSLGSTSTGQTWTVIRGTWGITGNTAYPADGCPAPGYAVIDSGNKDGTIAVTATVNPQDTRIPFRVIDANNLYWVERKGGNPGFYELDKIVNGVSSVLASSSIAPKDGDIIKIILSGPSINVYINGASTMSATDGSITSSKHGIGTWCSGAVRFNDFTISVPSVEPSSSPVPTPTSTPIPTPTPSPTTTPTLAPSPSPTPIGTTGHITGKVYSSAGGVIAGVSIKVQNGNKTIAIYTTNTLGNYSILNLQTRNYSLNFAKQGFVKKSVEVSVIAGQTQTVDMTLTKR